MVLENLSKLTPQVSCCVRLFSTSHVLLVAPTFWTNPGMEMFHKTLDRAEAGDTCGILIKGAKREDLKRGMVAVKAGTLRPARSIMATVSGGFFFIISSDFSAIVSFELLLTHPCILWQIPGLSSVPKGRWSVPALRQWIDLHRPFQDMEMFVSSRDWRKWCKIFVWMKRILLLHCGGCVRAPDAHEWSRSDDDNTCKAVIVSSQMKTRVEVEITYWL